MINKTIILLFLATLLTGCKLLVYVTSGGDVESSSGFRDCAGGQICEISIADKNFSETFIALPRRDYIFVKWQSGKDFLCGGSTSPTCTVTLSGDAFSQAIVSTYEIANILPVFAALDTDTDGDGIKNVSDPDDDNDGYEDHEDGCPEDNQRWGPCDTIFADGWEWQQVDRFTNLSWDEINAECPDGSCPEGASLNGQDLSYWSWARQEDLIHLFNSYIGREQLTNASYDTADYSETASLWAPAFFAGGWRPTNLVYGSWAETAGLTSTQVNGDDVKWAFIRDQADDAQPDSVSANQFSNMDTPGDVVIGAWFYRYNYNVPF